MQTADIRNAWLTYFGDRGHTVVPSASLVSDDPTLLFTVAGMVPFVPYLTGVVPAPFPRATSVQKCIRTLDIEEVGRTPRHGTFFQMNGNFSFGDYFKEQAIAYAWELLTTSEADGGLGFSPDDLWVTVYHEDDEARQAWKRIAGLPDERIQGLGRDTNYWHTGQPGPAGPCSEIFFDRGPAYGADGGPATDDDRYVEIWNLVFMQYLRGPARARATSRSSATSPRRTSTPAWASSASRSSSRASRTCTRSTRSARYSTARPSSPDVVTAPTTRTTCACASSPTTCAPPSC
ncbi:Alanine--tRNA ligase [Clavibacter michiganensis subsp. michiganensis]|nr:Alanine--tRNA ligase [Clavibacter michiganensis subsp. michiganensis]